MTWVPRMDSMASHSMTTSSMYSVSTIRSSLSFSPRIVPMTTLPSASFTSAAPAAPKTKQMTNSMIRMQLSLRGIGKVAAYETNYYRILYI
jgi:hypothetical protein